HNCVSSRSSPSPPAALQALASRSGSSGMLFSQLQTRRRRPRSCIEFSLLTLGTLAAELAFREATQVLASLPGGLSLACSALGAAGPFCQTSRRGTACSP